MILMVFSKSLRLRYFNELNFNREPLLKNIEFSFEVSSEGEFEQIAPIITHYLNLGKTVQLIIGSDSLIKKAKKLKIDNSKLDVRMVPLVSFFWIKSKIFI